MKRILTSLLLQPHPHNSLTIRLWDENNNKRYWSIGFFLNEIDDATIRVDHMERNGSDSENANCISPGKDDIQVVLKDLQILPCAVDGD